MFRTPIQDEGILQPCKKCNQLVHPSNLVQGEICLYCFEKKVHRGTIGLGFLKSFSPIYKYVPVVSAIIGLIIFFFVPRDSQALPLFISLLIVTIISFIASLPYLIPTMIQMMEDSLVNYKNYISQYDPHSIEPCMNHPGITAISRCPICFKPLCSEDFTFTNLGNPNQCRSCIEKYMNFEISATVYYLFATSPLSILGVVNDMLVGFKGSSVIFLFMPFSIFFLPLGIYLTKRTLLSKSAPN